MSRVRSGGRLALLWLASFGVGFLALAGAQVWFDSSWISIGLRDPELAHVASDRWLITEDGRLYNYAPPSGWKWWVYFSRGSWYEVRSDPGDPVIAWGVETYGDDLVLGTISGEVLRAFDGPPPRTASLGRAPLIEPLRAVGQLNIGTFAASATRVVWYSYEVDSWQVLPGRYSLDGKVASSEGRLVFESQGDLHYLAFELEDPYSPEGLKYVEGTIAVPGDPELVDFAASGPILWLLTLEGRVLALSFPTQMPDGELLSIGPVEATILEEPPPPPTMTNPRLVPENRGAVLGPEETFQDLWILGEEGAYKFDKETQAWQPVNLPATGTVRSVGGLWTSPGFVHDEIDMLAISSTGKAFRRLDWFNERLGWLVLVGAPLSVLGSLALAIRLERTAPWRAFEGLPSGRGD